MTTETVKMLSNRLACASRSIARAAAISVRASVTGVLATRSFAVDTDSHDDFKPKKKAAPAPTDPKELFPEIEKTIKSNKVVLYMKGSPVQPMCGFSAQVVRILNQYGVEIHGVNILEDQVLRQAMKDFSSWPTFPQLYVNGEFIGGCDIVTQAHQSKELEAILAPAKA